MSPGQEMTWFEARKTTAVKSLTKTHTQGLSERKQDAVYCVPMEPIQ